MAEPDSPDLRPEGFQRVSAALAAQAHPHRPLWLDVAARTAQEAADALGVTLGQIAKSVVFRRKADDSAVLVITSGDKRVDESKLKAHTGALGRADAEFVKARTGFSIGGVSRAGVAPAARGRGASAPQLFIDRELFRFDVIWAAAGHPNGVFKLTPAELERLTRAPVIDVVQS
jgi:prolyl-tRNA editing enzyme YbaK/EbsC (Cys-tRNA(Pro) deacylase)